jgi:NAD(P)H-hydrate epimerase
MKTYSLSDVAIMEANAVAHGVTIDALMDHAGRVVAEEACRHLPPPPAKVGFLCGAGNNGGDGLAAAFYLRSKGYTPEIWLVSQTQEFRTRQARRRWNMISDSPGVHSGVPTVDDLQDLPLVIDAMIGTGGKGELKEPYRSAVMALRKARVPVLSIDLPTGLGTTTPAIATWTVALEVLKEGMESKEVGTAVVRSIGFPPEAYEETGPGEFLLFPLPGKDTSKGESGRLAIVGGGPYTGAPAIAALAALNAGCDMVFIVAPEPAATVVRSYSPNLIVRSVGTDGAFASSDGEALWKCVEEIHPDAILVGNGAGHDLGTLQALSHLVGKAIQHMPVVMDADATRLVNLREERPLYGKMSNRLLLTPNRRELYRILGQAISERPKEKREQLIALAKTLGATILLKGEFDLMTDGSDFRENKTHHPAMVVGGAGDALSGLVASLMAREVPAFPAARLATYWLGLASFSLFERQSYGIKATDLVEEMPRMLNKALRGLGAASARTARRQAEASGRDPDHVRPSSDDVLPKELRMEE